MQTFLENSEFLFFCLSVEAPSLEEQRERFRKRGENADISGIGNELLPLVISDLQEHERKFLLESACEREDVEAFGILTWWRGDTKYIAENDTNKFNLSIRFYCNIFEKGMFDTYLFTEYAEHKDVCSSYILGAMLRETDRRRRKEVSLLQARLEGKPGET